MAKIYGITPIKIFGVTPIKVMGIPFSTGGIDLYTKLMLHMNGTNGSTTFTDSELTPKTITVSGGTQISTTQYKFGGASGYFGVAGYLSIPDSDDWYFNANFTIDCQIRFAAASGAQTFCSQYQDVNNNWQFFFNGSVNALQFQHVSSGVTQCNQYAVSTWNANQWYHVQVCKSGSTMYFFKDGILLTTTIATGWGTTSNLSALMQIGASNGATQFNGYMDELRISNGIARNITSFTPPVSEYTT